MRYVKSWLLSGRITVFSFADNSAHQYQRNIYIYILAKLKQYINKKRLTQSKACSLIQLTMKLKAHHTQENTQDSLENF